MATRNSDFANPKPCEHLADYKLRHGLSGYKSIQKWLKASPYGKTSIKMCGKQTCPYAVFVVGFIKVYDPDFDKVVVSKNIMDMPSKTHDSVVDDLMRRSSKRKRLNPLMDLDFEKVQTSGFNDGSKGEIVLSVGIERPEQFGEYLFHELCVASIATCTTIQELLLDWWQHSANLASYEQQDAHEFFISVLDGIHEREGKERNSNKGNASRFWDMVYFLLCVCVLFIQMMVF
ncbi:hypothetical protein NC652_039082 [Populus alba x Populus x berolinensis]|nr:hypothetical protein NC652_039082 [Populus alba x Populus x berolinensis]